MHVIYCVRNIIDSFINDDSTVNVCALDLSKVFDRMTHYVLLNKINLQETPQRNSFSLGVLV